MERIQINAIPGLSAYRLSWLVSHLPFDRPNARGQMRPLGKKKALLRVLCDRYPNVWSSVEDDAAKVGCSERQVRNLLRELEFEDRLLVDITPGPARMSYRVPGTGATFTSRKPGGRSSTVQYFIRDRKILDWFIQRALCGEGATDEDRAEAQRLLSDLQSWQSQTGKAAISEQNPAISESKPGNVRLQTRQSQTGNPAMAAPEPVTEPVTEPERRETVSSEPANQPSPGKEGGLAGWMRLAFAREKKDGQMLKMKADEIAAVERLAKERGEIQVRAAWLGFIGADGGDGRDLYGLLWPVTAFIREFDAALEAYGNWEWLERSIREGNAHPSSRKELDRLGIE